MTSRGKGDALYINQQSASAATSRHLSKITPLFQSPHLMSSSFQASVHRKDETVSRSRSPLRAPFHAYRGLGFSNAQYNAKPIKEILRFCNVIKACQAKVRRCGEVRMGLGMRFSARRRDLEVRNCTLLGIDKSGFR